MGLIRLIGLICPIGLIGPISSISPISERRNMEVKADSREFHEIECDALVVAVFEGEKPEGGVLAEIDRRSKGVVSSLVETGELTGKSGESAYVHNPGDMKARRLLLLGVGKKEEFNTDGVRKMAGTAARTLRGKKARSFAILRRSQLPAGEGAQAATEGALISLFDPDKYHTSDKTENPLQAMALVAPGADAGEVGRGAERGRIIAEATNFARELINEPANVITPTELARRAENMAREHGLEFDALDEARMKELGMGAFLGGAREDDHADLRAEGRIERNHRHSRQRHYLRHRGHFDQAVGRDGEDEIRHGRRRDSHRRDARQLGATRIIDLATLTGAVSIALGDVYVALLGTDQAWIDQVLAAAKKAGEKVWQLPLDKDYREQIKSEIADIKNVGGRKAGTITGAYFIREFAEDTPWAHLDIAGTAWNENGKPYLAVGPTGVGLRTLVNLVCG